MKIRICSECGKHNLETAWSCAKCGETLSVNTVVELDAELDELVTAPNDGLRRQKTVSIGNRPVSETNRGRVNKSELTPSPADNTRDDLYMWGLGLIALGIAHFLFSDVLDPVWGVVIIVIGVINFVIPQRGMFIVNGLVLFVAGLLNISNATALGGGVWGKFGLFQLVWGVLEMRNCWVDDSLG